MRLEFLLRSQWNEIPLESQHTFHDSRPPSGRFISELLKPMCERGSVHSVGGLGRQRLHLTDEEIDILVFFCGHPHNNVSTTASKMNIPRTAVWRKQRWDKWHPFSIDGLLGQEPAWL